MTEVFRFAALGVGAGALYALAAVGLVLVHRGSGVVNFAQGAMGMVGAYVYFEGRGADLPDAVSVVLGLLAAAVLGAAFHLLILRRMRGRPASPGSWRPSPCWWSCSRWRCCATGTCRR
ncbi:hypothetical protein [Frankia sp. ArI3]|uniref:ABC transporter permease subunit n=1 Tax=Frankia sp. ArI3 TaxID=1858 RepID=UPI002106AC82|nr:hypothetical protein [Frankia sp. ArI3]